MGSPDSTTSNPPTTFPPPVPPPKTHNHTPAAANSLAKPPKGAPEPSVAEGIKTLRPYDVTGIHLRPCARESLLTGIGSGFAVGGLRFVIGATQYRAMSWAVGAFCLTSMGAHAFCREKRRLEKQYMDQAKEIMEVKKKQKMEEVARIRREERVKREEEERARSWKAWLGWR